MVNLMEIVYCAQVDRENWMESVSSLRWLWEKEIFYRIAALPYFKTFM